LRVARFKFELAEFVLDELLFAPMDVDNDVGGANVALCNVTGNPRAPTVWFGAVLPFSVERDFPFSMESGSLTKPCPLLIFERWGLNLVVEGRAIEGRGGRSWW